MTTARSVDIARAVTSYLLRSTLKRIDWSRLPAERRRGFNEELLGALLPLAISERSTLGWFRALCARFEINASGGSFTDASGTERVARPIYAVVPRRFAPEGTPEMAADDLPPASAMLRWDVACGLVDFAALRILLHENAAFFVTFAAAPPDPTDEQLFTIADDSASAAPWRAELPKQLIPTSAFKSMWTCVGPVHHGADEKHGNVSIFRRERSLSPVTGEQYLAPFIAGNAVRGMWRDLAMHRLMTMVGLHATDLPPKRAHALLAGGTIEAGADSAVIDLDVRAAARSTCPPWDLLGGCIEKQMMRGSLHVHDAVVVCRENAWLVHQRLGASEPLEEFAARLPVADDLTQLRLMTRQAHRDLPESGGSQMLVNVEGLLKGTQLLHSFQFIALGVVSEVTRSCMADLLEAFAESGVIGAKAASGYGRIAFDSYVGEPSLPSPEIYRAWVAEHREEVREWMLSAPKTIDGPLDRKKGARAKKAPAQTTIEVDAE